MCIRVVPSAPDRAPVVLSASQICKHAINIVDNEKLDRFREALRRFVDPFGRFSFVLSAIGPANAT